MIRNPLKRNIAVLGSTGSIGLNSIEVIRHNREIFNVVSLVCGEKVEVLKKQIAEFSPSVVSVKNEGDIHEIKSEFPDLKVFSGEKGILEAVSCEGVDTLIQAIPGTIALNATVHAIEDGLRICLANKETLVAAGEFINDLLSESNSFLIPIDSEQSAIFQVLCGNEKENLKKVILTASGGPFFKTEYEFFRKIKKKDALNHPTWLMGDKITIDSATLMNKAFEVIEAYYLFGLKNNQIDVIIHPQSIIHSMVEYIDSSVFAQISSPDMKLPIQYSLTYPQRKEGIVSSVDFASIQKLEFFDVDGDKFPSVGMAFEVLKEGKNSGLIMNASNEVAVESFLRESISFIDIFKIVEEMLNRSDLKILNSVEDILSEIREVKSKTKELIERSYS